MLVRLLSGFLLGALLGNAAPAFASLVAYYQYENAGNLGLDSSGNGNNLSIAGGVTAGSGEYGGGASFNGTNAYLYSNSGTLAGLPTGNSSYTIATWFNASTWGGNSGRGGLLGWGSYGGVNNVVALRLDQPNNGLKAYWWSNDLLSGNLAPVNLVGSGWHFTAVTYDNASGAQTMYLDGSVVASRTAFGLNSAGVNFAIGRTCPTPVCNNELFNGLLDNTAIYDNALNSAQVTALMNGSPDSNAAPEPASIALLSVSLLALARRRRQRAQARS